MIAKSNECTACAACQNVCPTNAIHMVADEYGYNYPQIDMEKCVKCNLCSQVCNDYNTTELNSSLDAYVSVTTVTDIKKSASGGVFAALAKSILQNGGVVSGCAFVNMQPKHIIITSEDELECLQGSKYVQSEIGLVFKEIKNYLQNGNEVLFCGTPCQVDGLKKFLKTDYENLILIDLICHGVPNSAMFADYVKFLEKHGWKVKDLKFRDKTIGWGLNGKFVVEKKQKLRFKILYCGESSYYRAFLNGDIYRENCYNCKYAQLNRTADFTIGDYWGIEKEHPQLLEEIDIKQGVSCLLVNTKKGKKIIEKYGKSLRLYKSTPQKVAKANKQLSSASVRGKNRTEILEKYKNGGYEAVEKAYRKRRGIKFYLLIVKNRLKRLINSALMD